MASPRFQRIEELFHAAAELSPDGQGAFLAEACGDDSELRREIESLLADRESGVLEHAPVLARLTVGATVGPYRILSRIGAGGMGEVWKAFDARLNRDVAIKTALGGFDARFRREAQAIAALNHPNICTLFDVGPDYLVMEYVEGEDLKGPVPLDRALEIAGQIAAALEAAHEKGIVHRDLKPGNIKIKPDGSVKVLDFGLAKSAVESADVTADSPTLLSGTGMILGTAGYMSPEQAKGKEVDKRADIFAFGVVLYELITGGRLFQGETVSETLAAVIKEEPDLTKTPPKVRRLLKACLEKEPKKRLRDIGDWTGFLDDRTATVPSPSRLGWPAVAAMLAIVGLLLGVRLWRSTRPVDHPLTRLNLDLGPDAVAGLNTTVAISPDGRRIVYPVRAADGKQLLATRLLDQAVPTLLAGTENGFDAFFSPDSQWIGFFAAGLLRKISVQGGAPVTLSPTGASNPRGASWGDGDRIVATLNNQAPLSLMPAAGGLAKPITTLAIGQQTHRWPQVLPGGEAVLFTASITNIGNDNSDIDAVSLKTGQVKVVQRGGYYGRYVPGGYLLYVHQGALYGVAFDPARLETRGAPVPLLDDLAADTVNGGGQFDVSRTGTLAYLAGKGTPPTWRAAWLDRSGKPQPLSLPPGQYGAIRLSPDGRKLSFTNGGDIYLYDLEKETTTPLTFSGGGGAVWAPDSQHIAFQTKSALFWIRSDGGGEPQRLLERQAPLVPWSFSPDGKRLAFFQSDPETLGDLWTLPLDLSEPDYPKPGKPESFLRTPTDEREPTLSPDGRWLAYRSDESGTMQIYVRPFPAAGGGRWQISAGRGARYPIWSKNGRELFYETADNRIMVVDYTVNGNSLAPGKPKLWSDVQLFYPGNLNLDLAPDGKRFIGYIAPETGGDGKNAVHVTMLLNFLDELKRRIP
jgi:serine/threonine-protein kinase